MKHAFLIMIHNNFSLVSRLLKKLDHPDNTVYIHVDAKAPFTKEDEGLLLSSCKQSEVLFTDRLRVNWGGYSQVKTEMHMLEFAVRQNYDYYHFLSGVDFPTKPMEHIHGFFEKNAGCEFIHFTSEEFNRNEAERYKLFHLLQEKSGRGRNNTLYSKIERNLIRIQRRLKVDRTKKYKNIDFRCGSNWVSITHGFVEFLLSRKAQIKKLFSNTLCCDEVFVQTLAYNSPFREKLFAVSDDESAAANLRSVDWARGERKIGTPYTYSVSDYEALIASPNLFCRKVTDSTPDGNALIEKLEQL